MVKIFLTVRNRLAMTKKCIEALKRHSTLPYDIYVYNNHSNYLIDEHFDFFKELYKRGDITQVSFTTTKSTFNAFSKAVTCNLFGLQHEQDPQKNKYTFLLMMDNDIIVTPEWDKKVKLAWKYVNKNGMKNIKVVGQLPGGIKPKHKVGEINGVMIAQGKLGGSGFWAVRNNFFSDVGLLNLPGLVGQDKKHDQMYWKLMERASNGQPYILGLREKLAIHCGKFAGSICNRLTRNKRNTEMIKFPEAEKNISEMTFDEFYKKVTSDQFTMKDW